MITGGSTLDPGFPTWGTMLREQGYETWWYGKWHLTHKDNKWTVLQNAGALERYGFAGGTYPSPDGGPGQGWRVDPLIANQFEAWFAENGDSAQPWCTTVSFVNPHDIAWWHKWSEQIPSEAPRRRWCGGCPPTTRRRRCSKLTASRCCSSRCSRPRRDRSGRCRSRARSARKMGAVHGPVREAAAQRGRTHRPGAADARKRPARGGEHGRAVHLRPRRVRRLARPARQGRGGLRGGDPGAADRQRPARRAYLGDPPPAHAADLERGRGAAAAEDRQRLGCVALGTAATRTSPTAPTWRRSSPDPRARGRPYVLHATDEIVTEFATELYAADAPLHVVAMRTANAKFATYSNWSTEGIEPEQEGQERELYDYRTRSGRLELDNGAGTSRLEGQLNRLLRTRAARGAARPAAPPAGRRARAGPRELLPDGQESRARGGCREAATRGSRTRAAEPVRGAQGTLAARRTSPDLPRR